MARKKIKALTRPKQLDKDAPSPKDLKDMFEKLFSWSEVVTSRINDMEAQLEGEAKKVAELSEAVNSQFAQVREQIDKGIAQVREETSTQFSQFQNELNSQVNRALDDTASRFNAVTEIILEKERIITESLETKLGTVDEILSARIENAENKHDALKENYLSTTKKLEEAFEVLRLKAETSAQQKQADMEGFIVDVVARLMKAYEEKIVAKKWIKDLKEIAKDIEKLKKTTAREFRVKLDEISNIVAFYENQMKQIK
ncbi:MAG: hypothetical protein ACTSU5_18280 [Promethearchaeota archaeon]